MTTASSRRPGRPRDVQLQARRQQEILEEATKLFSQQGFSSTEVQTVADRLGVGKGTIYRYFPSKEALFLAAVDRGMRRLREAVESAADAQSQPLEQIAAAIRAYLAYFDEHPEVVELLIQERAQFRDRKRPTYFVHRDANIGRWHQLLRQLMEAGVVRRLPVERLADVISDLLYGSMFTNYFNGRTKSVADQSHDILDLLFHGMLTSEESPDAKP